MLGKHLNEVSCIKVLITRNEAIKSIEKIQSNIFMRGAEETFQSMIFNPENKIINSKVYKIASKQTPKQKKIAT